MCHLYRCLPSFHNWFIPAVARCPLYLYLLTWPVINHARWFGWFRAARSLGQRAAGLIRTRDIETTQHAACTARPRRIHHRSLIAKKNSGGEDVSGQTIVIVFGVVCSMSTVCVYICYVYDRLLIILLQGTILNKTYTVRTKTYILRRSTVTGSP